MRLLIDTHLLLWSLTDDEILPRRARALMTDPANKIYASAISIWEIAVKYRLQRGSPNDMPMSGTQALGDALLAGYAMLPVTAENAAAVDMLPRHHGDPFDRFLVAQAISENVQLLTHDARLAAYGASVTLV